MSKVLQNKDSYNNLPFRLQIHSFASRNIWCNLPSMLLGNGIKCWKGFAQGKTAVIAAGGNSLEEALPTLKKIQDKVFIIAAGSAIGALKKAGIVPHFLVIIDPFELMGEEVIPFLHKDINLILPFSCTPAMALAHEGNVYFYKLMKGNKETTNLEGIADFLCTDSLLTSLNVALTAIGFSIYLGCAKTIFVGLDLAIVDEGKHHADGVTAKRFDGQRTVEILGQDGKMLKTLGTFAETVKALEMLLPDIPAEFINSSAGGAMINGLEHKNFNEAIAGLSKKSFLSADTNIMCRKRKSTVEFDITELYQRLEELIMELNSRKSLWSELWVTCWHLSCRTAEDNSVLEMFKVKQAIDELLGSKLYVYLQPMLTLWCEIVLDDLIYTKNMKYTKVLLFINKAIWAMESLQSYLSFNMTVLQTLLQRPQLKRERGALKKFFQKSYHQYTNEGKIKDSNKAQINTNNKVLQIIFDLVLLGEMYCLLLKANVDVRADKVLAEYIEMLIAVSEYLTESEVSSLQPFLLQVLKAMENEEKCLISSIIDNELKAFLLDKGFRLSHGILLMS